MYSSGNSLRLSRLVGMTAPVRRRSTPAACPFSYDKMPAPATQDAAAVLPYKCIPSAKGLPLLGTTIELIRSGGSAKIHEYCDMRHQQLGPIFKEKMGAMDVVVVSSENYIRDVYNAEGKYPEHMVPEAWELYNEKKGITRGLFFMNGPHWRERRSALNRIFMPKQHDSCAVTFHEILTDLHERWWKLAEKNNGIVPSLEKELYNWSIESLGIMVFNRRLGCVNVDSESQMHKFVYYVQQIFKESATMAIIPPKIASTLRLPVWRRFETAADNALEMARTYVEQGVKEIKEMPEGETPKGLLKDLMAIEEIDHDEMVQIVADLILAAADTTSHATQWALHCLATHPRCQEKLLSAIQAVVPPGKLIAEEDLRKIKYASNIIKETLRLYPIASFLTRVLPRKIVLGNYEIPAGKMFFMSQYTVGRNPKYFSEPDKFIPERWNVEKSDSCLPFGFGPRACIGRKVAEIKMVLLLARTVQQFHLESANEGEVGIQLRMITTPDQPIKLRLRKRNT